MSESRVNPKSITLHNGKVLVAGGNSGPTIELYDPITDRWTTATTEMSRARQGHELALLNDGKVLIHGGGDTSRELRHDYEIFGLYPSVQLTAVNGVEPYTFEVVSGHANLSQSGVLTPFQTGVVRVRVTDAASDSDEIDVIVE